MMGDGGELDGTIGPGKIDNAPIGETRDDALYELLHTRFIIKGGEHIAAGFGDELQTRLRILGFLIEPRVVGGERDAAHKLVREFDIGGRVFAL